MTSSTVAAVQEARIHRAANLSAWGAASVGLIVLALQSARVFGDRPSGMKTNAAVAVVLLAAAFLSYDRRRVVSRALAGLALAVTALTLVEHVARVDLRIDELLIADPTRTTTPGRMAWETAVVLALLSIGALFTSTTRIARHVGTAVLAVALFVILAYLFGALNVREPDAPVRMAPETALAAFLLAAALLLHRDARAWPRLLFSDSPAGLLVRRFIPAAVTLAFLIGWLRSRGEERGLLDLESGITVSVTANLLILVALVLWWGQRLERDHQNLIERDAALMASEERFRLASMATNDAIYDWDIVQGVRTWNAVMAEKYGYPLVDSGRTGLKWLERVHPEDRESVARGWIKALEGGDPLWRAEYRSLREDGTVVDILERTFIVRDPAGIPVRAIGALTDLTAIRRAEALLRNTNIELERRVAERTEELAAVNRDLRAEIEQREEVERELRRQRDFAETLFEASSAVFIVLDRDRRIIRLNRAGMNMTGYSAEELAGRAAIDVFSTPENRAALEELGQKMVAGEVGDQLVMDWLTRTGERRTMAWMTSPIMAEDGSVEYLLGAGIDVTAEHAAQEELRHQTERLAAINAELEAFSYSVSHDLRAPLRSIDGFGQALIEDNEAQLDEDGRSYLRRIRAATQKMGELIDGLLELSRVSRAVLLDTSVDLSAIAAQTVERLREQDPSRNVDVSIEPSILVQGDARLLRIVMENLLENAWKFTSKTEGATIQVGQRKRNGSTEIFIRDNGAGFDPQYASKLFGAFQRLHPASEFAGTGIGLATVQRIVARHEGTLAAEGEPGRGATFSFTIGGTTS